MKKYFILLLLLIFCIPVFAESTIHAIGDKRFEYVHGKLYTIDGKGVTYNED